MDLFLTYMQILSQNISNNAKHPLFGEGTNADSPSSSRRNSKFSQDKGKSFVNLHSKSPGRAWQAFLLHVVKTIFTEFWKGQK